MIRQRNPITALCPNCRFANSVGLRELLAQAAQSICCQRCQTVLPIALLPGLPARQAPADDRTPPPPTVPQLAITASAAASAPHGGAAAAARGVPVELWYAVAVLAGLIAVALLRMM